MNDKTFERILEGVRQSGQYLRGELEPSRRFQVEPKGIKLVRESYGMTQPEFAEMLGVSVASLRNWEQGRREPAAAAKSLITSFAKTASAKATTRVATGRAVSESHTMARRSTKRRHNKAA